MYTVHPLKPMKSWKTSLFGILAAAAGGVAAAGLDPTITKIAMIIASVATAAMGFFARDKDVTSEQQGVK